MQKFRELPKVSSPGRKPALYQVSQTERNSSMVGQPDYENSQLVDSHHQEPLVVHSTMAQVKPKMARSSSIDREASRHAATSTTRGSIKPTLSLITGANAPGHAAGKTTSLNGHADTVHSRYEWLRKQFVAISERLQRVPVSPSSLLTPASDSPLMIRDLSSSTTSIVNLEASPADRERTYHSHPSIDTGSPYGGTLRMGGMGGMGGGHLSDRQSTQAQTKYFLITQQQRRSEQIINSQLFGDDEDGDGEAEREKIEQARKQRQQTLQKIALAQARRGSHDRRGSISEEKEKEKDKSPLDAATAAGGGAPSATSTGPVAGSDVVQKGRRGRRDSLTLSALNRRRGSGGAATGSGQGSSRASSPRAAVEIKGAKSQEHLLTSAPVSTTDMHATDLATERLPLSTQSSSADVPNLINHSTGTSTFGMITSQSALDVDKAVTAEGEATAAAAKQKRTRKHVSFSELLPMPKLRDLESASKAKARKRRNSDSGMLKGFIKRRQVKGLITTQLQNQLVHQMGKLIFHDADIPDKMMAVDFQERVREQQKRRLEVLMRKFRRGDWTAKNLDVINTLVERFKTTDLEWRQAHERFMDELDEFVFHTRRKVAKKIKENPGQMPTIAFVPEELPPPPSEESPPPPSDTRKTGNMVTPAPATHSSTNPLATLAPFPDRDAFDEEMEEAARTKKMDVTSLTEEEEAEQKEEEKKEKQDSSVRPPTTDRTPRPPTTDRPPTSTVRPSSTFSGVRGATPHMWNRTRTPSGSKIRLGMTPYKRHLQTILASIEEDPTATKSHELDTALIKKALAGKADSRTLFRHLDNVIRSQRNSLIRESVIEESKREGASLQEGGALAKVMPAMAITKAEAGIIEEGDEEEEEDGEGGDGEDEEGPRQVMSERDMIRIERMRNEQRNRKMSASMGNNMTRSSSRASSASSQRSTSIRTPPSAVAVAAKVPGMDPKVSVVLGLPGQVPKGTLSSLIFAKKRPMSALKPLEEEEAEEKLPEQDLSHMSVSQMLDTLQPAKPVETKTSSSPIDPDEEAENAAAAAAAALEKEKRDAKLIERPPVAVEKLVSQDTMNRWKQYAARRRVLEVERWLHAHRHSDLLKNVASKELVVDILKHLDAVKKEKDRIRRLDDATAAASAAADPSSSSMPTRKLRKAKRDVVMAEEEAAGEALDQNIAAATAGLPKRPSALDVVDISKNVKGAEKKERQGLQVPPINAQPRRKSKVADANESRKPALKLPYQGSSPKSSLPITPSPVLNGFAEVVEEVIKIKRAEKRKKLSTDSPSLMSVSADDRTNTMLEGSKGNAALMAKVDTLWNMDSPLPSPSSEQKAKTSETSPTPNTGNALAKSLLRKMQQTAEGSPPLPSPESASSDTKKAVSSPVKREKKSSIDKEPLQPSRPGKKGLKLSEPSRGPKWDELFTDSTTQMPAPGRTVARLRRTHTNIFTGSPTSSSTSVTLSTTAANHATADMQHELVCAILQRPQFRRSPKQIDFLHRRLKSMPAFMSPALRSVLKELCSVATVQRYAPDQVVFKQGDEAQFWYIIIGGSVNVKIKVSTKKEDEVNVHTEVVHTDENGSHGPTGSGSGSSSGGSNGAGAAMADSSTRKHPGVSQREQQLQIKNLIAFSGLIAQDVIVRTMHTGEAFGEQALVADKKRTATVVACPYESGGSGGGADLMCVDKFYYNTIIRWIHAKERKEKMAFLHSIPIFTTLPEVEVQWICDVMQIQLQLNKIDKRSHLKADRKTQHAAMVASRSRARAGGHGVLDPLTVKHAGHPATGLTSDMTPLSSIPISSGFAAAFHAAASASPTVPVPGASPMLPLDHPKVLSVASSSGELQHSSPQRYHFEEATDVDFARDFGKHLKHLAAILVEGFPIKYIYFIRRGRFVVTQKLRDTDGQVYHIRLGELGPGDYMGQSAIFTDGPSPIINTSKPLPGITSNARASPMSPSVGNVSFSALPASSQSPASTSRELTSKPLAFKNIKSYLLSSAVTRVSKVTVTQVTAEAEVGAIPIADARLRLRQHLQLGLSGGKTREELVQLRDAHLQRRRWEKFKSNVVRGVLREKLKDPTFEVARDEQSADSSDQGNF